MALTYEPFDTITVSKVNEKLGGGVEAINGEISVLSTYVDTSISTLQSKIPINAATQDYVDTKVANYLPLSGGTLTGEINTNNHRIYGLLMPNASTDAANKKYVDDKCTITTQTGRFPQRNVRASGSYTGTVTLSESVPLSKFVGVHPTSLNNGLIFTYNLSVDSSNIVQAINIAVYNITSIDITAVVSFVVQYYI